MVQQNKITVEQARARIISLNATVEAMLAETTALTASGMGRTANLTTVPLTTQPVVDPVTGKANMKELFHKGSTRTIIDRIARALGGVRTSGAGYNIETTKPRFEKGGFVPGTGNTDTYHTTAEAGSFVINKAATERHLPLITNILGSKSYYAQQGGQVPVVLTPGEAVIPAAIAQKNMPLMYELNGGPGNTSGGGKHLRGGSLAAIIRSVTGRGRQYRAKALLDDAGIPIPKLQNSVYPFSHSLNLLIVDTYLGQQDSPNETKILMSDDDNSKHFEWCWDKTVNNFLKEDLNFENRGEHFDYFKSFFDEIFYTQKDEKIRKSITNFFTDLFDINKPFTKSDLDMVSTIYKILDKHLSKKS
jgi:hypothetical protein